MHWTERRQRFRALIAGKRCVYPGSVFDPISARIAEDLGFEVGMFAGSTAALAVLGAPDLIVLTLSEFAQQANRICRAGNIALLVDADHGYGNALNVMRTVDELETAGVCALTIEDTDLPRPFGTDAPRLIPLQEGVGKMKAALATRQDPELVIAARTGALAITGLEDTLRRIRAYERAGVDAVFLTDVRTREDAEAIADAVGLPIFLGAAGPEIMELDYLSGLGIRICLQGHQPFMAAVQAVHTTLKALREGANPTNLAGLAPPELMNALTRAPDYRRWTKEYLED